MAKSSERYNAYEQADFTQTEAEEWATEIAIRIQEGNIDPIPSNKNKHFEQYDFTYASLFSGIGGFEQALNKLGGTCVFASEFDKFAQQSYTALYGDEHLHGDITKIDEKDVPEHDLLVGGFPCQAFSVAGKREGFADTRGTLFFDIARIAAEKKPKALLLENVKGLINHDKGNTLDTMIKTLNDIGYVVDFDVLNSKYFGVPQNRERIFIVAIREDLIEAEPFSEESTIGQTIVPKGKRRIGAWAKTFNFDFPEQAEVSTRLRDILEPMVDEKYYLDEEKTTKLVAQLEAKNPEERMSRQAVETFNGSELPKEHGDIVHAFRREHLKDGICPTISTRPEGFKTAPLPIVHSEPQMLGHVDLKGNDSIKRNYSTEGISPTLTTMGSGHCEHKIAEEQGLPIREATKKGYAIAEEGDSVNVQFPDSKTRRGRVGKQIANTLEASSINQGVVEGEKRTPVQYNRKSGIGKELEQANTLSASDWRGLNRNQNQNAVLEEVRPVLTPDRMEKRQNGRRFKGDGEESFTLTSQDKHGIAIGNPPKYRIRKLTPLECFRLQGFPDEAHEAVKQAGISDSQRYKQAGNAVTVNVIEAIAKRLIPIIAD